MGHGEAHRGGQIGQNCPSHRVVVPTVDVGKAFWRQSQNVGSSQGWETLP